MSRALQQDWGEDAEPGPEDKAKRELSVWLRDYGAEVYWEKRNAWDYPTFWIDGRGSDKPDLLIDFGTDLYVVEAKSGLEKSGVYDSHWQLMRYWQQYVCRDLEYVLGEKVVDVDGFLTATRWSKDGHLFNPTFESRIGPREFGEGRCIAIERGEIPPTEYTMTEQHVRNLWRHKKTAVGATDAPAVGSLLSTALEQDNQSGPAPAVLATGGDCQDWRTYE